MKLLVATTNAAKLLEIEQMLAGLSVQLVTLWDFPGISTVEETGRTFAENARQKATLYARAAGLTTVAEDSGLEIDALGGRPGVESARFGGAGTTYPEKFALLYEAMRAQGAAGSAARFVCALAVCEGGNVIFETEGRVEGKIAPEPRGTGGFGYDPIFFYPPFGQTFGEAGAKKHTVSHRAAAFRQLRRYLETRLASAVRGR
jgi:XTP/dITP diphosphohydrolase